MDNPTSLAFKIALLFCNHSTPILRIGTKTYYVSRTRQRQLRHYSWMCTLPSLIFLVAMTRIMRNYNFFDSFMLDLLITFIAYLAVFYLLGILVIMMFLSDAYIKDLLEESDRLKAEMGDHGQ